MARQPINPGTTSNPVGQVRRIRRASRAVSAHLSRVQSWLLSEIDAIPVRVVNDARYDYQIDLGNLRRITTELAFRLAGDADDEVVRQTMAAYEEGTGQSVTNLSTISDDYTRSITQVLSSQPYMRRTALIRARVFEEMQGFSGGVADDLGRVLSEAVENGLNPMALKSTLSERFDISRSRAERIARTEITGALRRARLDEAQDAQTTLGIRTGMLWKSALLATTRASHAQRHGLIYSQQEVREFYSVDGNGINCRCTCFEVLLNAQGEPVTPRIVDRLQEQKAAFYGK